MAAVAEACGQVEITLLMVVSVVAGEEDVLVQVLKQKLEVLILVAAAAAALLILARMAVPAS